MVNTLRAEVLQALDGTEGGMKHESIDEVHAFMIAEFVLWMVFVVGIIVILVHSD